MFEKPYHILKLLAICLVIVFMSAGAGIHAGEPIRIGLLCPLTGPYAKEALSQKNFALLAAKEINASGGIMGRPIEILVEDTLLKPARAIEKARELIKKNVVLLIGGLYSSEVTAVSRVAHENGVLHFGLGGSNDLTGKYCNRHHFNLCPAGYQMVRGTGNIVLDTLGLPREWYTITVDYSWGHTTLDSVKKMLAAKNGVLVGNSFVPLREDDFSAALVRAVVSDAGVLCIIVYGQHQADLLQQVYDLGIKKKMDIVVIASNLGIASGLSPEVTENVYMGIPWYWDLDYPLTRTLNQKYMDMYEEPGDWPGAQVYDGIHVMAKAVQQAGSLDPEKLIPVLEKMVFQTSKSSETIRACDHRAIQDWYVGVGKPASLRKNRYDILRIAGVAGGESIMDACEDTGCYMENSGNR